MRRTLKADAWAESKWPRMMHNETGCALLGCTPLKVCANCTRTQWHAGEIARRGAFLGKGWWDNAGRKSEFPHRGNVSIQQGTACPHNAWRRAYTARSRKCKQNNMHRLMGLGLHEGLLTATVVTWLRSPHSARNVKTNACPQRTYTCTQFRLVPRRAFRTNPIL